MHLDHLNLYVRDVAISRAFYESLLPGKGLVVNRDFGDVAVGFGDSDYAVLALVRTIEPVQAIHLAFRLDSRAQIDELYSLALSSGGRDNGAPGSREHYHENYYAAFVLDPDGHNLEFVCHEPPLD